MGFKTGSQVTTNSNSGSASDVSPEDWLVWNEYMYNLIDAKEFQSVSKDGDKIDGRFTKKKKLVGTLGLIVDCGLQPQTDESYDWKGEAGTENGKRCHGVDNMPEGYSEAEKEHVRKYPDNYFVTVDGKRLQYKPSRPTQEFAFYFDFPAVMIDWTKCPNEDLHHLGVKPLRVCYNGYFCKRDSTGKIIQEGFGKQLRFEPNYKTGKVSPNNPIYKLAVAMGKGEEFSKDYYFGCLAGASCFFDVFITRQENEQSKYNKVYPATIKNYSEIVPIELPTGDTFSIEQQIPKCNVEPIGVMLDEDSYTKEALDIICNRRELKAVLPRATSFQPNAEKAPDFWLGTRWEDSKLCKALGDRFGSGNSTSSENKQRHADDEPKQENKPTKKEPPKVESKPEPVNINTGTPDLDDGWDDDKL